jgi:succinate dehydrogenase / fumarate reductase flavoprotein subunit
MAANPRIIVVGGGLAGLSAVIKIADAGGKVDLFSIVWKYPNAPIPNRATQSARNGTSTSSNYTGNDESKSARQCSIRGVAK